MSIIASVRAAVFVIAALIGTTLLLGYAFAWWRVGNRRHTAGFRRFSALYLGGTALFAGGLVGAALAFGPLERVQFLWWRILRYTLVEAATVVALIGVATIASSAVSARWIPEGGSDDTET